MHILEDHYQGHLCPGQATRILFPQATIIKACLGSWENNTYLLTCRASGDTLLIDAVNSPDEILGLINHFHLHLSLLVTTHLHADHWQALGPIIDATGVTSVAHYLDAPALPVAPKVLVDDGDQLMVGTLVVNVIHLQGHTPGGIALALPGHFCNGVPQIFTGDSLFPGGVGKTTNPTDFTHLLDDVTTKLFDRYPDQTVIYPGHGDNTTLGAERPHLLEWRARGW